MSHFARKFCLFFSELGESNFKHIRGVFKTLENICDRLYLQKWLMAFSRSLLLQKSSFLDNRQGRKYVSAYGPSIFFFGLIDLNHLFSFGNAFISNTVMVE